MPPKGCSFITNIHLLKRPQHGASAPGPSLGVCHSQGVGGRRRGFYSAAPERFLLVAHSGRVHRLFHAAPLSVWSSGGCPREKTRQDCFEPVSLRLASGFVHRELPGGANLRWCKEDLGSSLRRLNFDVRAMNSARLPVAVKLHLDRPSAGLAFWNLDHRAGPTWLSISRSSKFAQLDAVTNFEI